MSTVLRWARRRARRLFPPKPLTFPRTGYELVTGPEAFEEEQLSEFGAGLYFPVNIGDVYASKYQVVGKLGFGSTSTVWLARRLEYVPQHRQTTRSRLMLLVVTHMSP